MKVVDLLGNEIKAGEFVAYATSCTASGKLRRGVIKSVTTFGKDIHRINLKSLIPDGYGYTKEWKRYNKLVQGNTSQQLQRIEGETFQFKGLRLGSIEQAFTESERNIISQSSFKIKFGE